MKTFGSSIVEIAFDITENQLKILEKFVRSMDIPFYIEPLSNYQTLEELEADCEKK